MRTQKPGKLGNTHNQTLRAQNVEVADLKV